jgi:sugar lactone lactonase YvrE
VVPADKKVSGGDGSTTSGDQVFVTSHAGIQVFHASGKAVGIIPNPTPGSTPVSCAVAGVPRRHLYVCDGPRVWRRILR